MPFDEKQGSKKANDFAGFKNPNLPEPDFPATYTGPPPLQLHPN
jgi:hypothetical protein